MKISEGGRGGGVFLLKEWSMHSLSRGLVIKLRFTTDAYFLVSVVELTPFLSISVRWFWLLQTRKRSPGEMVLLV